MYLIYGIYSDCILLSLLLHGEFITLKSVNTVVKYSRHLCDTVNTWQSCPFNHHPPLGSIQLHTAYTTKIVSLSGIYSSDLEQCGVSKTPQALKWQRLKRFWWSNHYVTMPQYVSGAIIRMTEVDFLQLNTYCNVLLLSYLHRRSAVFWSSTWAGNCEMSSVAVICQVGKSWQNMSWCNGGSRSNPLSWNL